MNRGLTKTVFIMAILTFVFISTLSASEFIKPKKKKDEKKQTVTQKTLKDQYHETVTVNCSFRDEHYWDATSNITLFTQEDIEKLMQVSLGDILRYAPGVTVQQSGSPGKVTGIRLRGAGTGHTLLLIDGIPMTDPALGLSLFAPVTLSGVERIEVIRGAHSPLYGSSASGGVINIITKKGKGDFQIRFFGEADYQTVYDGNISVGGRTGVFSYYADYQTIRSDGQHDNDNYKNNTFNIKCDFDFSEKTALHLSMHYIDSLVGIPIEVFFGEVNRDINSKQSDLNFFGSATLETELFRNVDSRFSFSFMTHNQNFQDPADPGEEFAWPVDYKTETVSYSFNFSNSLKLGKSNTLLFGMESRSMSAVSTDKLFDVVNYDDDFNSFGIYIQNRLDLNDKFFLTASLRYDDFGDFGDTLNPRLAAAWRIAPATKLTAAFSTGFRIPSLNELYYPFYGNQDLLPEKSEGYELGIEQFLAHNNLRLSFTYFSTDYTDLISYDFATFQAENISSAEASGIEFSLDFKTKTGWSGALGYTYTASENLDTGERLIRLPESQLYFTLGWKIGEYTFDILSRYVSDQLDYPVAGFPEYNEAYFVADAHLQYRMTENVSVFLKARNLFNAEYFEVKGYKSHGRRWFIGFYFR